MQEMWKSIKEWLNDGTGHAGQGGGCDGVVVRQLWAMSSVLVRWYPLKTNPPGLQRSHRPQRPVCERW